MKTAWRVAVATTALLVTACNDRVPMTVPPAATSSRSAAALDLGSVDPGAEFDFVVGLRIRAPVQLRNFLGRQVLTGDTLSPDDFADLFAVSPVEYRRVVLWLQSFGFTITRTVAGRTAISVHGTAAQIEDAFGVDLHNFEDGMGRFVASIGALTLSSDVAGSVSGVAGDFDGAFPWVPHHVSMPPQPAAAPATFTATALESLYVAPAAGTTNQPGSGEGIAILGAGNPPALTDISKYLNSKPYGLTLASLPDYTQELIGGPTRDGQNAADEQVENTLDIEMIAAFAPYATIHHVVVASNGAGLFTDGISYIVNTLKTVHSVSLSYGSCERGAAGEMPVMNALFAQAKAEGQTWFAASGDDGGDGCRDGTGNKILSVGWPASSPSVVGVGGTQINSGTTELAWDSWGGSINGAGGGGVSEALDKPAFQMAATPNDGARDEPDVAALAGPPGVVITINGANAGEGGTSAAAPMWAGAWALIEQHAKNHVGITNGLEELYTLGAAGAGKGLTDIAAGATTSNGGPGDTVAGGYPVKTGYDLATGWGSPNITQLIANWQ